MPNLRQRSHQLELLDAPDIAPSELFVNLQELDTINRWLGGHRVTLNGLQQLMDNPEKVWHLADIGCGGGDTLRAVAQWARQAGFPVRLTGIDLKADCLNYARQACWDLDIQWLEADYQSIDQPFDIVFSSLFCHHLNPEQLRQFLHWSHTHTHVGWVINDLQRHPLAYHGIQALTQLLSHSYLVKNDAPLSVWRGFQRADWQTLLAELNLNASIQWHWAFRWLIVGRHEYV